MKTSIGKVLWVDLNDEPSPSSLIDALINTCGSDAGNCSVLMATEDVFDLIETRVDDKRVGKILSQIHRKAKLADCDTIIAYA